LVSCTVSPFSIPPAKRGFLGPEVCSSFFIFFMVPFIPFFLQGPPFPRVFFPPLISRQKGFQAGFYCFCALPPLLRSPPWFFSFKFFKIASFGSQFFFSYRARSDPAPRPRPQVFCLLFLCHPLHHHRSILAYPIIYLTSLLPPPYPRLPSLPILLFNTLRPSFCPLPRCPIPP